MTYEIETKDGIVIRGIPDDIKPDDPVIKMRVEAARGSQSGGATTQQKIQASLPMRLLQGMRDPIDAGRRARLHSIENARKQQSINQWICQFVFS
jgi:hypothetical protein